jgi:3-oxoacyl-[acyl-carrier protein] reductase
VFAREGARVAIAAVKDREALEKTEREIAEVGSECIALLADVARRGEIDRLVQAVLAKWGRIDVLVNNAGILRLAPLENISEERWDDTLAVHLKGTFNCTQAVIPIMKQQKKGKIINIAAPSALRGSFGVADYAAAKGGIIALTKNAASELKAHNIQVNCISPVADTRLTEELTKFRREQLGIARRDREFVPPEAIAPAFLFFATADSDYVSGQLIEVGRV